MNIEERINHFREELRQHNYNYYVLDNATISDYDFDIKLQELQKLEADNPEFYDESSPTLRVGGEVTKNFETIKHTYRMYSLDNSYSKEMVSILTLLSTASSIFFLNSITFLTSFQLLGSL